MLNDFKRSTVCIMNQILKPRGLHKHLRMGQQYYPVVKQNNIGLVGLLAYMPIYIIHLTFKGRDGQVGQLN